jgi:hypothetical protein
MECNRLVGGLYFAALVALLACGGNGKQGSQQEPQPPQGSSTLQVEPPSAEVAPGDAVTFSALAGSSGALVTWTVVENGGGTIDGTGRYTAPSAAGTFHVVATSTKDPSVSGKATVNVTTQAPPPPTSNAGTGASHSAQYVSATGAGPRPSLTGAPAAACAGNGSTDDTSCLQRAIDSAHAAGKPLTIPATSSYYKISGPLHVTTSIIGTGGMPTIQTATTGSGYDERGAVLQLTGSNLWIENLHLVGTYGGGGNTTGAQSAGPNISIGNVSGVTIVGNHMEGAQGDAISDHYQEMDGGSGGGNNVLVLGNTMERPYRCCISLVAVVDRWAVLDNVCNKGPNDSSSPFDYEPWHAESSITNIETAWNSVTFWVGSNQDAPPLNVNGWADPSPGGNIYVHHNFGSWPDNAYHSFVGKNGPWSNVVIGSNVVGTQPPP